MVVMLLLPFVNALGQNSETDSISLEDNEGRIHAAFHRIKKEDIANAVFILDVKDVWEYDYILTLPELLEGRVPGFLDGNNLRGWGAPVYIVDGALADVSFLSVSEIEQIVVLKDVNSAVLFGNSANNGIVLVTTKRGAPHKTKINLHGKYGFRMPKALPKYLSSADYMTQYDIARANDGLSPFYGSQTVEKFRSGNRYIYPDVDYYCDEYLKSIKPYSDICMDFSGGNKTAFYWADLMWTHEGSLLNFGEGKNAGIHTFKVRGNMDMKVNERIKTSIDVLGLFHMNRQPNVNYWESASLLLPNAYSPFIPITTIDPENILLKSNKYNINGKYLPGGNVSFQTNPIADVYLGGKSTVMDRIILFSNRIDVNLNDLIPGLEFHTNFSGNYINTYRQYIENKYAVYEPQWNESESVVTDLVKFGEEQRDGVQHLSDGASRYQYTASLMFDYEHLFDKVHQLSANLIGFGYTYKYSGTIQPVKNVNFGTRVAYGYKGKYFADFSGTLVHSVKLHPNHRWAFSPSLGLAWILTREDGMQKISIVDFLKLKVSGGMINTDAAMQHHLYADRYTHVNGYSWYEGLQGRPGTAPEYSPNPNLTFEKRVDINIGIEGLAFDKRLGFDINLFENRLLDGVDKPVTTYPSWFQRYIPYENLNRYAYRGVEIGLSWKYSVGLWNISAGSNLQYLTSEVLKMDELHANDFQYRKGHPVDAYFGLVSDGFFANRDEIANHATQAFGSVQPGDIRYKDLDNSKGVDANDIRMIGRSQSPLLYSLNLQLAWKNLTLFALGLGRSGAKGFLNNDYYWAQGNSKYSEYMLNHWTEATAETATYPRLTTRNSNNNYLLSDFWLYDNRYFKLQRVQLTYRIPLKENKVVQTAQLFFTASDLLTFAPAKEIITLNIGSEPQYGSLALGMKLGF